MGGDNHRAVDLVDTVDHHRPKVRKQNPATALPSHNPREHHTPPTDVAPLNSARFGFTESGSEPGSWLTLVELFGSHPAFSRGHQPQGERAGWSPSAASSAKYPNKVSQIVRTFTPRRR